MRCSETTIVASALRATSRDSRCSRRPTGVVRPGDGPGLVDALRTLSGDAALRQELGANGRHAAERLFDKREIDNDFIEYLERLDRSAPAVGDVPRPVPSERT